jgi:pyruvate/2-oxoglutarate dehydrogenase complex dihydrolipoamide dehydrogenase (E3) component
VFESRALPKQLVVIGAGPVGLELAQAFRRLGADVTVLESGVPLSRDDPESARIVLDRLRAEGIDIRTGVTVERVRRVRNRIEATLAGGEVVDGSDLLIATGRKPALDGLGLEAARIRTGPEGIVVDRRMRTSNRSVFAIGDAVGAMPFTHVANYHAGLVIRNALFRQPAKADYDAIPRVTFTDPELAHVGLTEAQARRRHRRIRVLRWPYHENDRAVAERDTAGHIKVVTDRKGTILGATIVGSTAGELIMAWTLAISQRMNVRVFAEIVVPYPTLSEIGKRAAVTAFAPRLTSPWVRRILGFLRRFG